MADIVELTLDRDLIDPDFAGYKLSLDPVPIYETNLETPVYVAQTGENQISYAHARVFSLHNHLLVNAYTPDLMYYVDDDWNVFQVSIGLMNRVDAVIKVCAIPRTRNSAPGDFPVTVQFASAQRAVVFDGIGNYHVALVKKDKWVVIFTDSLSEKGTVLSAKQIDDRLCILTRSITEQTFVSFVDFFALDENWQTSGAKKIQVSGNLLFAGIASLDSVLIVTDGRQKMPVFVNRHAEVPTEEPKPKYEWTQTADDFLIIFKNAPEARVSITGQKITITSKNEEIINGEFAHGVKDVTWTVSGHKLEVTGFKEETGLGWQEVIKGDTSGKQFQAISDDVEEATFNAEELEEVDEMGPSALFRLRLQTDTVTHMVDLSTLPFLFSVDVQPDCTPGLCFRNSTDACVWTFQEKSTGWTAKHVGTFPAFGYVQASKTQRKFITAPGDFSYAVISDVYRHLYLFRQPGAVNGDLRNRTTGARVTAVAKQQLINLENNDEILGIFATRSRVHLLTKRKFYILVVSS